MLGSQILSFLAALESTSWIGWARLVVVALPLLYVAAMWDRRQFRMPLMFMAGMTLLLLRAVLDVTDEFPSLDAIPIVGADDPMHQFYQDKIAGLLGLSLLAWAACVESLRHLKSRKALANERRFRDAVLGSVEAGVVVQDESERVLYINPKAAEVLAVESNRSVGAGERASPPYPQPLLNLVPNGTGSQELRAMDGKTFHITEKRFPGLPGIPGITVQSWWDVTSWERSRQLSQEFISAVSHEFRTPLTSVRGYLELVMEDETLSQESREYLEIVHANVDRLVLLVEQLLDLSRIESGVIQLDLQTYRVEELIEEAVESLATEYQAKRLTLHLDLPQAPVQVKTDRERLLQILSNLLSNACKYTPEGGEVTVQLRQSDNQITMGVIDTGIGIPEEERSKIFTRFFRTSKSRLLQIKGTGLGLAITQSLVDRLGGSIWFSSNPSRGTTFTFALPMAKEESLERQPLEEAFLGAS